MWLEEKVSPSNIGSKLHKKEIVPIIDLLNYLGNFEKVLNYRTFVASHIKYDLF